MEIYRKTYFWVGVVLFNAGMFLNDFIKNKGPYLYIMAVIGVFLMLFAFKKTK